MKKSFSHLVFLCALTASQGTVAHAAGDEAKHAGVNRPHLVALSDDRWKAIIDEMHGVGVRRLRTELSMPITKMPQLVRYANDRGMEVVLLIPTWLPQLYPDGTKPRPGNKDNWDGWRLSEISFDRFKSFWTEHRLAMRAAGARVLAYQLGNEINGAAFNGDYPIGPAAHLLELSSCDPKVCTAIRRGYERYVDLLRVLRESGMLDEALLVAAGMVPATEAWAARSQGYFSASGDAIARLQSLDAGKFVDAYAVQIYPNYWAPTPQGEERKVQEQLSMYVEECNRLGRLGKPCWITEWGIWSADQSCERDGKRDRLLQSGVDALRRMIQAGTLGLALHYDWDGDAKLSVYRCGRIVTEPSVVR